MKKITGYKYSKIVTPNGKITTYDRRRVTSTSIVSNLISKDMQDVYLELFGGN